MADNTVNCPVCDQSGFEIGKLPLVCPQCGRTVELLIGKPSAEYQAKLDAARATWAQRLPATSFVRLAGRVTGVRQRPVNERALYPARVQIFIVLDDNGETRIYNPWSDSDLKEMSNNYPALCERVILLIEFFRPYDIDSTNMQATFVFSKVPVEAWGYTVGVYCESSWHMMHDNDDSGLRSFNGIKGNGFLRPSDFETHHAVDDMLIAVDDRQWEQIVAPATDGYPATDPNSVPDGIPD